MVISKGFRSNLLVCAMMASQAVLPLAASAGPVRVAGQNAFVVTTGGASRTATIQKNLDNALVATTNRSPSSVGIVYVKGQPVITVGGFYVTTVDAATAKSLHTTPSMLAQKWAGGIKTALKNPTSVADYVAQLTSSGASGATASTTTTSAGTYSYYKQGRIVYVPAGMMIPVAMRTNITSETARPGDPVEAQIAETVNLGDACIPQGSTLLGVITESAAGQKGKSGTLGLKFTDLRTLDGQDVPITAHIVGGIGQYDQVGTQSGIVQGENKETKVKEALMRGAVGAGSGALLGTALGAIASEHSGGAGRGAIAGTIIGGGLGVAESLLLRKGSDVKLQQGQTLHLQLDAPASMAITQNGAM